MSRVFEFVPDDDEPDEAGDKQQNHAPPPAPPPRFKLVRFDKIVLQATPAYLVAGLIPRVGLIVIWGPPKCGKSFWVFDLLMHVALSWPYRGRKVRQGDIVYLALEGHAGFNRRAEAFRTKHSVTDAPFYLVTNRTDLVKDHRVLIADIPAQSAKPAAVVIDTLNRSIAGSESKDEDMSAYIKAADAVREAFDCAVVIIHHCGVDETRPRGHTSLRGAVDAELAVKRDAARNIVVEVEWMKDGDSEGAAVISKLERFPLGIDEDGNELSSCVVVPVEGTTSAAPARGKLSDQQRLALEALTEALLSHGGDAPPDYQLPYGTKVVQSDQWKEELYRRNVLDREASNPRARFNELRNRLTAKKLIGVRDDLIWPAYPARQP